MRPTILSIAGTRPQLIKQAALQAVSKDYCALKMVYTGQHYDDGLYLRQLHDLQLENFHSLPPETALLSGDYRLAAMIQQISAAISTFGPQAILVMGDTDSTLAGALAAERKNLPLIHVEAGERCGNFEMPEEWNRTITDRLSTLLCCASVHAVENLREERHPGKIVYTGDLMKDLLLKQRQTNTSSPLPHPYYFLTLHRNYTQNNKTQIEQMLEQLNQLDAPVVFPVHPSTRKSFLAHGISSEKYPRILFSEPLVYSESIRYQQYSRAVITDSGGMQKEAYWLKKKCVTIRKETEWKDTLKGNWNTLWYDMELPFPAAIIPNPDAYDNALYGNGSAGHTIFQEILKILE